MCVCVCVCVCDVLIVCPRQLIQLSRFKSKSFFCRCLQALSCVERLCLVSICICNFASLKFLSFGLICLILFFFFRLAAFRKVIIGSDWILESGAGLRSNSIPRWRNCTRHFHLAEILRGLMALGQSVHVCQI